MSLGIDAFQSSSLYTELTDTPGTLTASLIPVINDAGTAIIHDADLSYVQSTNTLAASIFSGDLLGTINTATTGTTQSGGDNSTKIATTAYVDAASVTLLWSRSSTNLLPVTAGDDIGATGTRINKGWFTDLEVTNAIAGAVTGNAGTVTNGVYTTDNLSVMASTTSLQLLGLISDETGTGKLVFATAPTFTTSITVTDGGVIDADGIDLVTGNDFQINNVSVINATTLGGAVVASSLTSVGTLTSLTVGRIDQSIGGTVILGTGAGANDDGTTNNNVFVGVDAGASVVNAVGQTFVGYKAGEDNNSGNCTFFGFQCGMQSIGSQNTAVGADAMKNTLGHQNNTVMGYQAGYWCQAAGNSLFGVKAGYALNAGVGNCLFGYQAGNAINAGSYNIIIGYDIDPAVVAGDSQIRIGSVFYATTAGAGIGAVPLTNMLAGQLLLNGGALVLSEIATPTADANYGKIYTKTDNELYFQDGAGSENKLAHSGHYGEMYMYDASQTITINTTDKYHAVLGFSTGLVDDFTFDAGRVVDANLSDEANPSGSVLRITTSAAHNLTTGDTVSQNGMNDVLHNGITMVTVVDGTNYDCDDIAYVAGAGASAGVVDEPSYLQCGTAGNFRVSFSLSGEAVGVGKLFKWELNKNSTALDKIVAERNHANTDIGSMASSGFVTMVVGDRLFLSCKNKSDDTDFTISHANINIKKL